MGGIVGCDRWHNNADLLLAIPVACVLTVGMAVGAEQDASARARHAYARAVELETAGNHAGALSLLWVKAGKGEDAVQRARALAAASPEDPDRYFTLGLAQSEQHVTDAVASFRRVLGIAPRHTRARRSPGRGN